VEEPWQTSRTASGTALRVRGRFQDANDRPRLTCLHLVVPVEGGRPLAVEVDVAPDEPAANQLFAQVDRAVSGVVLTR
jgi:hypothetical protein